jgi:hypothetical protein
MSADNFFVYCPNLGFEVFETLDDALDDANERTQEYLDDTWNEEVTSVCVGRITHRAKMCDQVYPVGEIDEDGLDEAGEPWDPDYDYKCNYKMMPTEPAHDVAGLVEALECFVEWYEQVTCSAKKRAERLLELAEIYR